MAFLLIARALHIKSVRSLKLLYFVDNVEQSLEISLQETHFRYTHARLHSCRLTRLLRALLCFGKTPFNIVYCPC